ncbi:orotidine-5'-phosphate decarboxylase [bacterium]|nr:orotidine-5'-phosphate decarboxylase [candidate division CSSED10-310 bacterium]
MEFSDRLHRLVSQRGTPLCVGFDPHINLLPPALVRRHLDKTGHPLHGHIAAVTEFLIRILDRIAGRIPIVKPQWAFFEQFGPEGMVALQSICSEARDRGLLVIADAKRGDIGSTAAAYANAFFASADPAEDAYSPPFLADAVTVNPYLGWDAVSPFLAKNIQHGVFVLVRTSNPSGDDFQNLSVDGDRVQDRVADAVREWGAGRIGECGWSSVGAVVGATYPEEAERLRDRMPLTPFLIPGFGAQGGSADSAVKALNRDGSGGNVNSSRDILFAYRKAPYTRQFGEDGFDRAAEAACLDAIHRLGEALHRK